MVKKTKTKKVAEIQTAESRMARIKEEFLAVGEQLTEVELYRAAIIDMEEELKNAIANEFLEKLESKNYLFIMGMERIPAEVVVRVLAMASEKALKNARSEQASKGGKKKSINSGIPDKKEELRKIWASGKYSSRDLCAEQEWAELKFKGFSTARKALRSTPEPLSRC